MINFSVDMRNDMSPIRDQRRRPTCMAFSASDAHAMAHSKPMSDLSVEYAHYSACKRMTTFAPQNATTVTAMLNAIRLDGQPPEAEWPYMATLPVDISGYLPPANTKGIVKYAGEELTTFDLADESLRNGTPVIMAIALSRSFYGLQGNSVLPADPDLKIAGYHAVLSVGMFSSTSGDGYLIRNSWGAGWGLGGYGLITRAYLEPRKFFLGVFRA
jgi:C1A family cysteine protease